MVTSPKNVVITGASRGIGEALASRYASEGGTLGLIGRDRERLERVAARCRATGCTVHAASIDVRDRGSLAAWLLEFDRAAPVDLVIANAGVSTGTPRGQLLEDADAGYAVVGINMLGVLNTVQPLLTAMASRGHGQIALMSSIAGFVALPDSPSYCASKSAVLSYGLALRGQLHATGIRVNVVCPGYITSPMSERIKGWKPLEMSAEAAVDRIVRGLARDRAVIAFPWLLALASRFAARLPHPLRRVALIPHRFYVASDPGALDRDGGPPEPSA